MRTPEEAQFIIDLRQRVIRNKELGKRAQDGIPDEDIQRYIHILQSSNARPTASTAKPATRKGKSSKTVKPMSDDELNSLFS